MTSWKTTVGGIIALVGGALMVVPDTAPGASYVKPWAPFIAALGTGIIGLYARDNNKSSEDVGVIKTEPPPKTP